MKIDPKQNTIVCGDNIDWLEDMVKELKGGEGIIDLCYIDPPFFSGLDRDIVWKNGSELRSFGDKFKGDVRYYIEWIKPRLEKIHKLLKPSGSIFVHCDYHASHRLRCLLDDIFKPENFKSEIIWKRTSAHGDSNSLGNVHDTIYFYTKSNKNKFNSVFVNYSEKYLKRYKHTDGEGKYLDRDLSAKGLAGGGYTYKWKGVDGYWRCPIETMEQYEKDNLIYYTKKGTPRLKQHLKKMKGKIIDDLWLDINAINSQAKERIGYPTQKPEELVKRIIECATDDGDLVLDCFSGGGTTAKACVDLKRKFIVGDVSPVACKLGAKRLNLANFFDYEIKGMFQTEEELRSMNGHIFAETICDLMGWKCNEKKSNDKGIDGWDGNGNPIQIKNQKTKAGERDIRDFWGALKAANKTVGVFCAWEFVEGKEGAYSFVAKHKDEVTIELRTNRELIKDILISNEKRAEIEKFYNERLPENWKNIEITSAS